MHDNDDTPTPQAWWKNPPKDLFTEDDYAKMEIEEENARLAEEQERYTQASRQESAQEAENRRFAHLRPGVPLDVSTLHTLPRKEPNQVIADMLDCGDKMIIVGHSKTRKTFLATQLAYSVAAGINFLNLVVPKKRKVLMVQYEVQPSHFIDRMVQMREALGIEPQDISGQFTIINARGIFPDLERMQTYIETEGFEVVIFDPFYKMFDGDESDVETIKSILRIFDRITTKSKCALIYVHHDKKGSSERTEQRDRGGGSGILARDYDVGFAVSEHDTNEEAIVIDILQRNYRHIPPLTAEWYGYRFIESELQPVVKKAGRRSMPIDIEALSGQALQLLGDEPMNCITFRELLKSKLGASRNVQSSIISNLVLSVKIKELPGYPKKGLLKRYVKSIFTGEFPVNGRGQVPDIDDKLF